MKKITPIFKSKVFQTFTSALLIGLLMTLTAPFVLAVDKTYKVEQVVNDGKDSKETDAVLTFKENSVVVVSDKVKFKSQSKEFVYADIKVADYSYSKKPMLSTGGAIATALLVGFIFAIPFLFMKKKNHWLSVQTEKEFAVIKLDGSNFRQIVSEMETHGVKVNTVKEEDQKKAEK